jgi:glycosyl transferase-like sugar-binding protein
VTPIPPVAHFIWFGREFLWVHLLALRSAAERGEFDRVILHHAGDLRSSPWWEALEQIPGVEARHLDAESLIEQAGGLGLVRVFRELVEPAGKANVVRAALLFLEGGTYLDSDTVTLRSFRPLLEPGGGFCGAERIIRPYTIRYHPTIADRAASLIRRVARSTLRETPGGWRLFRRIERWYPAAVNNAVLGSVPGYPLLGSLLQRMTDLPPAARRVRYALGTHLLQQTVQSHPAADFRILEPAVFYPLGPEISVHWFRQSRRVRLDEALLPETRLVHWYASVRTRAIVPGIDPAYVRAHASTQLFSALALPFAG